MKNNARIAIVQDKSFPFDIKKTMNLAEKYILEASQKKADVIAFGETWFSGYPAWIDYSTELAHWNHPVTKELYFLMHENGLNILDKNFKYLQKLAKQNKMHIVFGFNEVLGKGNANGSMFNSLAIINSKGELANHHRKLVPTFTEKFFHTPGDGHGLESVETAFGNIGGLVCWEHWMPHARMAMHLQNETIHFAVWPYVHEMHQTASRQYAFEGRCFVVAVGQLMQVKDIPEFIKIEASVREKPEEYILKGGTCIYGPNGDILLEPQMESSGLIIQDLKDLDSTLKEKLTMDTTGNYNRFDVFDFKINKKRLTD